MSPLYHLQVGSFIANARDYSSRERRLVMLASLAPDLDGIFFFSPGLWERFHHTFGHSIFWALLVGIFFGLINRGRRLELFVVCSLTCLLQVALDNVTNDPSWRIMYFWPASDFDFGLGNFVEWDQLNVLLVYGVQGLLMVGILAGTVILYRRKGRTFLEVVSSSFDKFITDFIVLHFRSRCSVCGRRASYREAGTGAFLCGVHGRIRRDLTVERVEAGAEDD